MVQHYWTVEEIDPRDSDALLQWAEGICMGLDIAAAAEAMNVAPTAEAIVGALTDSLPDDIRHEAIAVCYRALEVGPSAPR